MSQIGLIGLAVMGQNLARNIARNHTISVYNRSYERTQELLDFKIDNIQGFKDLKEFIESLDRPRKVMIMVKSGPAVDTVIESVMPFLAAGDMIVDLGNSNWKDTIKREEYLAAKGFVFIGCGVSGGARGALEGPSIMPGGDKKSVDSLLPFLESIAAPDFEGGTCTTNVGLSAAGHFVKMVHNGIEYAMMQAICEIYDYLKNNSISNAEMANIFRAINTGPNESFLLEITISILESKDPKSGDDLIDKIVDRAGAKGTGRWTVEAALELGIATPSISQALFARIMSARTNNFEVAKHEQDDLLSSKDRVLKEEELKAIVEMVFEACYIQGLDLILEANKEFAWNIDISQVVRIWQGGCIIRSRMLESLYQSFTSQNNLALKVSDLAQLSSLINTPKPVVNSVIDYLLTLSRKRLPANLIQAQRDHFGEHTYLRVDMDGSHTGGWKRD